ncbi:MAG: ribonuclease Y, partial [Vicinamibacterales bacterium]
KETLLDAKEKAHDILTDAERQARQERQQAQALDQSVTRRDAQLTERQLSFERMEKERLVREQAVAQREQLADASAAKFQQLVARQQHELERVASLTADEAKDLLLKQIEGDARHDAANLLKRLDAEARESASAKAKQYITEAIQRSAAEHAVETTVSVVDLPSDDLKGRIIGREGRNIRALELATGVDLIVDDTPGAIILSGFDPYRREVARKAIEKLIADGRIHPARIEEVVQKVKDETDEEVRKEGAAVAFELGLHDLHPEILRLMGRLKYRTSYGQNVLSHSAEVARLAGIMAREIGLDAHVSVRAAFLHDIGKAIDHEMQGTHLELGIDFLRKHGESEPVVMAMAAHHMDIDWPSLEAMIVQAADAISAARPGARRDILESYVKRLEKLEGIADSFKGVSKSFALQAGREIRIMVESEKISDEEAVWLSKDIARRIENELEYPGHIKVTVIRETRAVDYAK